MIIIIVINSVEKCLKFNVINFTWNIGENKNEYYFMMILRKSNFTECNWIIKSLEYF